MTKDIYNNSHCKNPFLVFQEIERKLEEVKKNSQIGIMQIDMIYDKLTYCQEKKDLEKEKSEKKDF